MKTHDLKIWPEFFDGVLSGQKTCELRKNDRGFAVGDVIRLREWHMDGHFFSGRETSRKVTHILQHRPEAGCAASHGLSPDYVILSFAQL